MVLENHPLLDDGSPFPTLLWLTCPVLMSRASALESEGWMQDVNQELAREPALKARLSDAIDSYRHRRDEHAVIHDSGSPPGGDPDRVKCLHAHVAHALVAAEDPSLRPNPVGAKVLASVGFPDCREPCFSTR